VAGVWSWPLTSIQCRGQEWWSYTSTPPYDFMSKSLYDRRSVDQSVLISSPIWGSWPDINFCLTFTVLSMSPPPPDGRSGRSSVLVTWTVSVQ
jgi:hypothetical protein